MLRNETRVVKIGNRYIGGDYPILIQSMTNTKTKDVDSTVNQILELEKYGCDTIYSIRIKGIGFQRNKLNKNTKVIEISPRKNLGSIINWFFLLHLSL